MDVHVSIHDESEAIAIEDTDDPDDSAFENERCGICADIVIDRGVLDCCPHWFCFACIDNWATITNLCPLCNKEFQLITCLPVYDTIGTIKAEEHSLSRGDDWCIQGKNNTLSFPSYYIDEDAVICLDGDQCKIRSGLSSAEEDLTLDTSIACDSCDIWYHAFCVAFNPESATSESSWLCPRCITDKVQQKSDGVSIENLGGHSALSTDALGWTIDPFFSGKVSVSVADAGETAVVVSMVGLQKPETSKDSMSDVVLDYNTDKETETSMTDTSFGKAKLDVQLENDGCIKFTCDSLICSDVKGSNANALESVDGSETILDTLPELDLILPEDDWNKESLSFLSLNNPVSEMTTTEPNVDVLQTPLVLSTSEGDAFSSCFSVTHSAVKASNVEGIIDKTCNLDNFTASTPLTFDTSGTKSELPEGSSVIGLSVSTSSAGEMEANNSEDMVDILQEENIGVSGSTRRHTEKIQQHHIDVDHPKNHARKREMDAEHHSKKAKYAPPKEAVPADIMSIVQDVDGPTGKKVVDGPAEKRDTASGLRVKKIMRRVGEKKESSILVQQLSKEISEAVQDKTSNDICNDINASDGRLLAAFRAAIVKPKAELVNRYDPSLIRAKKSLLQKGKTRENLTKKIYGTSTGRRKRAWDRDWEIEFWKHRCTKAEPEKVETLHSVLELLKKATNSSSNESMDDKPETESRNSILSRVYLADASVFPRNDDIKPLSALAGCSLAGNIEQNQGKDFRNQCEKESQTICGGNMRKTPGISRTLSQAKTVSSDKLGKRLTNSSFNGEASCRKGNLGGETSKSSTISKSSDLKGRLQTSEELGTQSNPTADDKRKWALEVLARKSASTNLNASKGEGEDKYMLKGKYPLLAQLPINMRPVLVPGRNNKVPVSVRQAQLYRIAEHYLKRANLPIIQRTADTELAIADAVNVEKEIFERSNSKLVYTNLCSQAVSQRANRPSSSETTVSNSTVSTAEVTDQVAEAISPRCSGGIGRNVEEALRLAGLSDSPPTSPCRHINDSKDENDFQGNAREQGPDNILDLDSHPEMDIYGDFEYDLEDDGCLGISRLVPQGIGDAKMKVVLSSLKCEEADNLLDSKHDLIKTQSAEKEAAVNEHERKIESVTEKAIETERGTPLLSKLTKGETDEPSLAECEELYGPEKEPLVNMLSDEVTREQSKCVEMEAAIRSTDPLETEKTKSRDEEAEGCAENSFAGGRAHVNHEYGGENSPAHSLMSNNAPHKAKAKPSSKIMPDPTDSISKKVEAYVKEHIRPLCKSGVITVEQYRWAVGKTTDKVMTYHYKAKNANFLIKEGEKVKKLAEQYVEAAQVKDQQ